MASSLDKDFPKDFTDIIGGHGPFQMSVFAFFFCCFVPQCFHIFAMTFLAPNVDHWCARPQDILQANISLEQWKNASLPFVKSRTGDVEHSHCTIYDTTVRNGTLHVDKRKDPIKCSAWEYDTSFYQNTMVDEWDLVCERAWLVSMSNTIYMVAFLIGATSCGQLSDRFGRRKVAMVCLITFLVASHLTLLSTNFAMFMALRFFVALGITAFFPISYVIILEMVSFEYRSVYCFSFKFGWVLSYMVLPGIAWLVPSWFRLQLVLTLPWLLLLCVFWVVPETPRWLLTHGKHAELEQVLMRAASMNGKDMKQAKESIHLYITHNTQKEEYKRNNASDLVRTPALRRNTLNIYFCWFIISYIYYALSWNTNDLGGDPYWNFFICGTVELPAGLIFMVICRYIGHRKGLLITNVSAGLCLLSLAFVPQEMVWLKITLSMSGKFFNSASFDIVYIYTAEIYPTVVRNVAVGTSSTCARIGAMIAPFIRQVADLTHPTVPVIVPGALSILSGLLMLLLTDTLGKKLPDTLDEGEIFARGQYKQPDSDKCSGISDGVEMVQNIE